MSDHIDFAELKATNLLPSPEGVMLQVMRLCQREKVMMAELAHLIQADPVLAGRIIKIANVAHPHRQRPFAAVTTDVLLLVGVHAVRQVMLGISLVRAYRKGSCSAFDYDRFWSRSLAMACAAQALAGHIRIAPAVELFTSGLLANIGRLGLASARPVAYAALLSEYGTAPDAELAAVEMQQFGFSHASLSAAMMTDWEIPRLFADAVLFHETPDQACAAPSGRQYRLALLLQLAGRLADFCTGDDAQRLRAAQDVFAMGTGLGLEPEHLEDVSQRFTSEWAEWCASLGLQTHPLPPLKAPESE